MTPRGDVGISNERTALAWQRTALSLLAGSAVMARLAWSDLGLRAAIPLGVAVVLSTWVLLESRMRYAHDAGTQSRSRSRSGRAPAALALATALIAVTELLAITVG